MWFLCCLVYVYVYCIGVVFVGFGVCGGIVF